jgi:hypothetical protein
MALLLVTNLESLEEPASYGSFWYTREAARGGRALTPPHE